MTENPPVDIYRPFHYNKFKKNTSGIPTYTNKHNETKQKQTKNKLTGKWDFILDYFWDY